MSLVGTRPILPDELEQYELHHRARIAIKPGITGMWQVSGRSDITDFEEIVRLDKTAVLPVSTEEYGLSKAARPFNSRLDKSKLLEAGFTPLPTWQDALSRYLKEIEQ